MSTQIAIVGIGGVFPDAPTPEQFWARIRAGETSARPIPDARLPVPLEQLYQAEGLEADKIYARNACLIDDVPDLDTAGLAIGAETLQGLDPLFRLGLGAAQKAWRDAGLREVDPTRTGVIIGQIVLPTELTSAHARALLGRAFAERIPGVRANAETVDPRNGLAAGLPGTLIARALGLEGGALCLDAACASSLYAVALAVEELLAGRMDAVLCGGLSRPDCLYTQMGFGQLRALSRNGRPAPFDARGDGLVVGLLLPVQSWIGSRDLALAVSQLERFVRSHALDDRHVVREVRSVEPLGG